MKRALVKRAPVEGVVSLAYSGGPMMVMVDGMVPSTLHFVHKRGNDREPRCVPIVRHTG